MAVFSSMPLRELAPGLVISPERYHPARLLATSDAVKLGELAELRVELVKPGKQGGRFLVLDTSDVSEGFIVSGKPTVSARELGSAKKLVSSGDVLVSRLRPYLRQIGLCDAELTGSAEVNIACSTEFFVLRGRDDREEELAFLVPYLLSAVPQGVLAASVEGGHHPRFSRETLLELPVPRSLLEARQEISGAVVGAVRKRREGERLMASAIHTCRQR